MGVGQGQEGTPLDVHRAIPGDPVADLAFEEELIRRAAAGRPGLFLYSWRDPVLVLGVGQKPESVDLDACRREGVPVLKRSTGGTGVLSRGDLAVSLALPASHPWAATIPGLYARFLEPLEAALRSLGVDVARPADPPPRRQRSPLCFEDVRDETFLLDGRKCVGCAQARRRGAALVHASILLDLKADLTARCFGMPGDRVRAALAALPLAPDALADAVADAMADAFVNRTRAG